MNQKIQRLILVLGISLSLIACKGKEKTTEPATTDTTGTSTSTDNAVKDAVATSPNLYKVLKDTMGIRVLETSYQPGDSSPMHSHKDYAVYATGDATATFYSQDGSKMETTLPAGAFMITPAEVHAVKNTGNTSINVILVEVTRGTTPMTWDKSLDATKVASSQYKLVKDTLGLRAITVNFKPGASAAMHAHPDVVLYVTEGSKAEFTDKAGKKTVAELTKGMVLIAPSEMHSVKNIGKTNMRGILVEVDRQ